MSSYHPADCALIVEFHDRSRRRNRGLYVKPARWTLLGLFLGESGTKIVHAYFPIRTVSTLQFLTVFEQATCKQNVTGHPSEDRSRRIEIERAVKHSSDLSGPCRP